MAQATWGAMALGSRKQPAETLQERVSSTPLRALR